MGGHIVLGHVDGVGKVSGQKPSGDALRLEVTVPADLSRFVASKGSIAVDGVSLTVNGVGAIGAEGVAFDVMLIPHTLSSTLLGQKAIGARVNIEVDVLARYVARLLEVPGPAPSAEAEDSQRLLDKLRSGGWL
jgi:riboflavin synthase